MRLVSLFETPRVKFVQNDDTNTVYLINDKGQVGYIEWSRHDGEIERVFVGTPYRRQGYGTELWNLAVQKSRELDEPEPEHSSRRSADGDAFAKAIGGHIPDLTDDIDGWTRT